MPTLPRSSLARVTLLPVAATALVACSAPPPAASGGESGTTTPPATDCDEFNPTLQVTPPDEEDFLTTRLAAPVCRGARSAMTGTAYSAQRPAS